MAVPQAPFGQTAVANQYGTVPPQQLPFQPQLPFVSHTYLPPVNDWSVGLFDCCGDRGLCCDVYLCGACQMARQHDSLLNGYQDSCNRGVCCGLTCCPLAQWPHTMYLRGVLRAQHGLQGNAFTDCLAALCCGPCVVCQTHKQLKAHGANPGVTCCNSSTPVASTPAPGGFVPQGPM